MCLIMSMDNPDNTVPLTIWEENLKSNPHGTGIMFVKRGKVEVIKNINGVDSQTKTFNHFQKLFKEGFIDHLLVHSRYKTEGAIDKDNCHPYKILDGEGAKDLWMMHNGTIKCDTDLEKGMSDSFHFANFYLKPMLESNPELIKNTQIQQMISKMLETANVNYGNKLVFMNGLGEVIFINKRLGTEKDGVWYSNDRSFPESKVKPKTSYGYNSVYNVYDRNSNVAKVDNSNAKKEENKVVPLDPKKKTDQSTSENKTNTQKSTLSGTTHGNTGTTTVATRHVPRGNAAVDVTYHVDEEDLTDSAMLNQLNVVIAGLKEIDDRELYNFIQENPELTTEVLSILLDDTSIVIQEA